MCVDGGGGTVNFFFILDGKFPALENFFFEHGIHRQPSMSECDGSISTLQHYSHLICFQKRPSFLRTHVNL